MSGDVAGVFADEVGDESGDFVGAGVAAHGDLIVEVGVGFSTELSDHVGMDDAGGNSVDTDAAVGDFLRQGAGEGIDGAFGGAVGNLELAGRLPQMELVLMMTPFLRAIICGSTARVQ